jgi:hypothetical protein
VSGGVTLERERQDMAEVRVSGRFRRLMSTNSVVIKTGIFTEWFQPHLIP